MPPQAANSVTNGPDGVDGDRRPQRILASLAPKIMHTRIVNSPSFQPSHYRSLVPAQNGFDTQSTLRNIARTRLLLPETWGGRTKTTATELLVSDPNRIAELLGLEVPAAGPASNRRSIQDGTTSTPPIEVSLIAGFKATVPSASEAKQRRRNRRAGLGSQVLGLDDEAIGQMQSRVNRERGLLTAVEEDDFEREGGVGRRKSTPSGLEARKARKARRQTALGLTSSNGSRPSRASNADLAVPVDLSLPELRAELDEIALDRAHLSTRKSLLAADREAVEAQIAKFSNLRAEIDRQLLALKEEDLELVDEEEGVVERIESLEADLPVANGTTAQTSESAIPPGNASSGRVPSTSRRRKGPAFLPSSHDALPSSTAFLTLRGHSSPLTALDFSSPYGTLVSASTDETVRLWDLTNGDEIGRLKGHEGVVKCLQVEGSVAVTGGQDGNIRVWDLEKAEEEAETQTAAKMASNKSSDGARTPIPDGRDDGLMREGDLGSIEPVGESEGSCMMRLSGHAQAVTSLYFDANTLVSVAQAPIFVSSPLIPCLLGHWVVGQDAATMGSHNRTGRLDHGHSLGDAKSGSVDVSDSVAASVALRHCQLARPLCGRLCRVSFSTSTDLPYSIAIPLVSLWHPCCVPGPSEGYALLSRRSEAAVLRSALRWLGLPHADAPALRRKLGHVPGLCRGRSVLGLCTSQWKRRRMCPHVG